MMLALISMLIPIVVAIVVSIRLLGVARRTRGLPEVGAAIGLAAFAVAQICTLVLVGAHDSLSPALSEFFRALTLVAFTAVSVGLAAFTVVSFGSTPWRWTIAATVTLAGIFIRITMFTKGVAAVGEDSTYTPLPSLAALTIALTFLWMGVEGVAYHRKAERARALGLASAEVVNRFLVFGIGGLISGFATVAVTVAGLLGAWATVGRPLILIVGLINSVVWALSFAPPMAYRRFIETRAARREASHG